MTTVEVRRDEQGVRGLRVSGHAGYASSGSDIVCAAASVLITTCANALESVAGIIPVVRQSQKPAVIWVELPEGLSTAQSHDARVILRTALTGFQDVAAQYPRYLQII
ncbi:MAG: ribosomal-processing cysteine protease Prp [Clostridiales bacterium]|nr:ribosomal-processing cysteine protease Prp [Clostridiales bacterium]